MGEPQSSPTERLIHKGRKFDFAVVTLPGRSGRPIDREIVRHPGAVIIVPLIAGDSGDELVFVRQLRVAPDVSLLELPAGTLERGENPFGCAARELEEETGFRAATVTALGRFYTSPGMSDEVMHAFVARDLSAVGQSLEDDEDIEVVRVPAKSVHRLLLEGDLVDGKSLAALLLAIAAGVLPAGVVEAGSETS